MFRIAFKAITILKIKITDCVNQMVENFKFVLVFSRSIIYNHVANAKTAPIKQKL